LVHPHRAFARLGGDSLSATQVLARLYRAFGVRLSLSSLAPDTTISELAELVDAARRGRPAPALAIATRQGKGEEPLTDGQAAIWISSQLSGSEIAYNIAYGLRFAGELDLATLRDALASLVQRHEALRLQVVISNSGLVQRAIPVEAIDLPLEDVAHLRRAQRDAAAMAIASRHVQQPFDLARPPLLRPMLIRIAKDVHLLALSIHHIACDSWSIKLMLHELATFYNNARTASDHAPTHSGLGFMDYAAWQPTSLGPSDYDRLTTYWRGALADSPGPDWLPTDFPRPATRSSQGGVVPLVLDGSLVRDLQAVSDEQGVTLYMALLAAFSSVLGAYSGARDIVVGSPVAARPDELLESIVGYVSNTLPLRIDLLREPTVRELLRRVRAAALASYDHQELPFARIAIAATPARAAGATPIFQTSFVLNDMRPARFDALDASQVTLHTGTAKLDLMCYLERRDQSVCGYLEYSKDLFRQETVQRLGEAFNALVHEIATGAVDRPVFELCKPPGAH
jgi:surfactin family lipopeptide synthetase A